MGERDEDVVRAALSARVLGCWERLEDAASELVELHGFSVDEIVARVRALASDAAAASD